MHVLRSVGATRDADKEIHELARDKSFHAYIPHSYFPPIQWAISHPLCKGFSYIEEGVTSYFAFGEFDRAYPPRELPRKAALACRILYGKRLPRVFTFFQEGYDKVYGFFDSSFPSWERKVTIGPSGFIDSDQNRTKGDSPILVLDAMVELGMLTAKALEVGVVDFLDDLVNAGTHSLRFKLHPGQKEESKSALMRAMKKFSDKIHFTEIARAVSLEEIFSKEDSEVFVFNSAAGLYASQAGLKVFSINEYVSRYDQAYAAEVGCLPEIYQRIVRDPSEAIALSK